MQTQCEKMLFAVSFYGLFFMYNFQKKIQFVFKEVLMLNFIYITFFAFMQKLHLFAWLVVYFYATSLVYFIKVIFNQVDFKGNVQKCNFGNKMQLHFTLII